MTNLGTTGIAATSVLALTMGAAALPAQAAEGTKPLSAVLTADGNRFDHNGQDFDIVTEAVLAVLAAKPHSQVGLLTKGDVALTALCRTIRRSACHERRAGPQRWTLRGQSTAPTGLHQCRPAPLR